MGEDLLAEPVFPTDIASDTETADNADNAIESQDEGGKNDTPNNDTPTVVADKGADKKDDVTPIQPQVREKSKIDYILERKAKQAERAKARGESNNEDEDDFIAAEDKDVIKRVIEQDYGSQFDILAQQQLDQEIKLFISTNELAAKATPEEMAKFQEYIIHPSRQQVPLETIMLEVLGTKRIIQMGAELEREASRKAGASKIGGSVIGKEQGESSLPNIDNMSDAEFDAYTQSIITGGRR